MQQTTRPKSNRWPCERKTFGVAVIVGGEVVAGTETRMIVAEFRCGKTTKPIPAMSLRSSVSNGADMVMKATVDGEEEANGEPIIPTQT